MMAAKWQKLQCSRSQLCLETVLTGGQSFRWKRNDRDEWMGVISGCVWRLKQTDEHLLYQVYSPEDKAKVKVDKAPIKSDKLTLCPPFAKESLKASRRNGKRRQVKDEPSAGFDTPVMKRVKEEASENDEIVSQSLGLNGFTKLTDLINTDDDDSSTKAILRDYFQLDTNLDQLYSEWSSKDDHFKKVASSFRGIRILRQDPVENLVSFVCSSNNHISRISSMVEKLCTHYGHLITSVDEKDFYAFPPLSALTGDEVETTLRQLGFGYRAKFISSIAKTVCEEKDPGWLSSLRGRSYTEAKTELMTLMGVGAKVADCVCLMSLDKPGAVPVDTHVWQITLRHYMASLQKAKSLTERIYNQIGDFYRDLWGPYAGWAHSVLFTADLRHNKDKGASASKNEKTKCDTDSKKISKSTAKRTKKVKT
ncbi:N-glycosylase/DNA lyase [Aplysia californica]|uniref:DNA-(apurinic or apyrimidinic site) lyase n=1 Tax=Aplysia californica TaxID=6500 RepID=A0ABM0JJS0_APLCA|nr:N-glycosylase/DNA lyase [Aplysia californica]